MAQIYPPWVRRTDIDRFIPPPVFDALLEALQISEEEFRIGSHAPNFDTLSRINRVDYCPLCFLDDLSRRRTPYFRFQWTIPYQTCCHVHRTPLVPWRQVRYGDERVLPLKWVFKPRSSDASACPWLDEDARWVTRFDPGFLRVSHPVRLLNRLADDLIIFSGYPRAWREPTHPFLGFNLHSLIGIAFTSRGPRGDSLATLLRPVVDDRLFGPPKRPYNWGIDHHQTNLVWGASCSSAAFRRSVLWFVARTVYGFQRSTPLANGEVAPKGDWERWWKELVEPNTRDELRSRARSEGEFMKKGAGWREAQQHLKRSAVFERILT